jgi:magnesium-transporting ATPase (P-type)
VRRIWTDQRFFHVTGSGYATDGRIDPEDAAPHFGGALDATLRETLLVSVLANEAEAAGLATGSPTGDPTEIALLVAAAKGGIDAVQARVENPEPELLPFEPERRFMVVFQFFHVFNCRSLDRSILRVPLFSNPFLFVSFVAAWFAHTAVLYWGPLQHVFRTVPLGLSDWGLLLAVGATVILGGELDKWRNRRTAHPLG